MTVRSIPRYPEVREDGSMWVPLAPPPAPKYRQLSAADVGMIGHRASVSYSTEWLLDLRIMSEVYEVPDDRSHWVRLGTEGAWHDVQRHGLEPRSEDLIVACVDLVFLVLS